MATGCSLAIPLQAIPSPEELSKDARLGGALDRGRIPAHRDASNDRGDFGPVTRLRDQGAS